MKRFYYYCRALFREWNFKRKYGISMDDCFKETIEDLGKHVILNEKSLTKEDPFPTLPKHHDTGDILDLIDKLKNRDEYKMVK